MRLDPSWGAASLHESPTPPGAGLRTAAGGDGGPGRGRPLSICVFCASASGLPAVHHQAARDLGHELGRRGHRLVYGGGNVGLMGEVARATHQAGGRVHGVIPRVLVDRELAYDPADELVVTETLRERKAEMDARADAFVALPGGFGTLEELLEVLTLRQLRLHDRPVVLVNVAGYWDPFLAMVRSMVEQGFAPSGEGRLFTVATTASEAIDMAEQGAGREPVGEPPTQALAEDWTAELPASQ
jgi:cytokinin riboside 5'-monophosphate phosphoribohydrolase